MKKDIEILTAFMLANIPEIITQEEFDDVKKSIQNLIKRNKELEENSIPKSVIREKIEELVNKIDGTNKGFIYACQVDLLEDLIGEISKTKLKYWDKYDD